ncbi:hypothetical protein [Paraburkholderia sp. CI3]|uniref:hypothetical protein n=1 Tax=Paraburkholderia sp. CI3 TaxID=2991060 RepID=UPI003D213E46
MAPVGLRQRKTVMPAPVILAQWIGDALRALARRVRITTRRAQRKGTLNPF